MIAYFETSTFVKLLVEEPGTDRAGDLWAAADVVVSSALLYPEARAAVARARRGGRLSEAQADRAVVALHELTEQVRFVAPSWDVLRRAGALAEVHGLRGYDAVHLASALDVGPATLLVTDDAELADAGAREALAVLGTG